MQKNRILGTIVPILLAVLVIGVGYYVVLPPLSPYSAQFWTFFFFVLAVIGGAGLLIQLAIRPTDIADIGFQLSYAAMAGIAYIHPHLKGIWTDNEGGHLLKLIWDAASLTISCQLTTGPLAYFHFKSFPAYFILTNLLALPLTSILIPVSILTLTLNSAGLCPEILTETCEKTASYLIFILETISAL